MPARLRNPRVAVSVVFAAAMFLTALDSTIVNTALPSIAGGFGTTPVQAGAVISAYLVSLAVFVPASGWLGDRFGDKQTLLCGLCVFVAASVLCGAAGSLHQLVAFRVLQGAGGGMLTPVGMAMLMRAFPVRERARIQGILIVPTALGPALGPALGGLLVDLLSWRWAFYVNVPLGAVVLLFGARYLTGERHTAPGRFDLAGFVLAGGGLATLMFALSAGPARGWGSAPILTCGVGGLIALAVLAVHETRRADPLLDVGLLRERLFATATVALMLTTIAFLGSLYVFALLQQDGLGHSALRSGSLTSLEAVGVILTSQVVRRVYPRIGPRRLGCGGALGLAGCCVLLSRVGETTSTATTAVLLFAVGTSIGVLGVPLQTAAFARVPRAASGHASSLFNAVRQLAGGLGVALLATVIAAAGDDNAPAGDLGPYHAAFLVAAAIALAGAALATRIDDADAAETMVRQRAGGRQRTSRAAAEPSPARRGASSADDRASARRDAAGR